MCINQKKCTKLGRDSSFEEACALKIFSGEVLALFLHSSSEESKSFVETQDVSVSEHARIDTIILLLLRNLLAHYLLALLWLFKRNIYVKCTNLLLWGLHSRKHVSFWAQKIHLLSTSIKKDGKKSQNFYGHQKSALLTLEKVTHSTGCIAEGLTSTTIPLDIGWK